MKRVVRPSALLLAILALVSAIGGRARADADGAALYAATVRRVMAPTASAALGRRSFPRRWSGSSSRLRKRHRAGPRRHADAGVRRDARRRPTSRRWPPTSRAAGAGAELGRGSDRGEPHHPDPSGPPVERPVFEADPLNLFVVVETGDHHVTILDGDRFEPIHRFATRLPCTADPSSPPTAATSSYASRDGWIRSSTCGA